MQETVKEPGWLSFDSVDFWTKYEDSLEKMTDDDLNVYNTNAFKIFYDDDLLS